MKLLTDDICRLEFAGSLDSEEEADAEKEIDIGHPAGPERTDQLAENRRHKRYSSAVPGQRKSSNAKMAVKDLVSSSIEFYEATEFAGSSCQNAVFQIIALLVF